MRPSGGEVRTDRARHGQRCALVALGVSIIAGAFLVTGASASAAPTWSITPSAVPRGASNAYFNGVSCGSAVSCFAVGVSDNGTLVEHWDGHRSSIVPSPKPKRSGLQDVSCPSSTSCFAVGLSGNRTLVQHWNRHRWSTVASPNPPGSASSLNGVACPNTTSCFAVGGYSARKALVEHWNGHSWSIRPSPQLNQSNSEAVLSSVACPSSTSCIAVGAQYNSQSPYSEPLVEHWNGHSWSFMLSPRFSLDFNDLVSVSCPTTSSCYAVGDSGYVQSGYSMSTPVAEHWDGHRWLLMSVPVPPDAPAARFASVSCSSATSCVAVGSAGFVVFSNRGFRTLVEQWDGTSWSIATSPNPSGADVAVLTGVKCVDASNCFTVGDYNACTNDCTTPVYPLTERYAEAETPMRRR